VRHRAKPADGYSKGSLSYRAAQPRDLADRGAAGRITKLTVIHDRLGGSPRTAANVAGGWTSVIGGLKTL